MTPGERLDDGPVSDRKVSQELGGHNLDGWFQALVQCQENHCARFFVQDRRQSWAREDVERKVYNEGVCGGSALLLAPTASCSVHTGSLEQLRRSESDRSDCRMLGDVRVCGQLQSRHDCGLTILLVEAPQNEFLCGLGQGGICE